MIVTPDEVHAFWFGDGTPRVELWFGKDEAFDAEIRNRFGETLEAASRGELDSWAETPRGLLSLVIVLDQFSRNAFRGTPRMFAQDEHALALVRRGVARGDDLTCSVVECGFFYLPFEHAEDLATQEESVRLFTTLHERAPAELRGMTASFLEYAVKHREIVERFGRFPHRNEVLGRESTAEEVAFLKTPGSAF